MKLIQFLFLAIVTTKAVGLVVHQATNRLWQTHPRLQSTTRRFSTTDNEPSAIRLVDKEEMEELLKDYNEHGREKSGYIVMDVRNQDEVDATGKLSESVPTCPLPMLKGNKAFTLSDEQFQEAFGFQKPDTSETLVFTCLAGKRAQMAAECAAAEGYTNCVVYTGGAKEWFDL